MKIEKLISIFEECIPIYQKAVDENWNCNLLITNGMKSGLCWFIGKADIWSDEYNEIAKVFKEYYIDYIDDHGYLCIPVVWVSKNEISRCIKPRLKFLRQQVKELKRLQDEGYTDV